MKKSNVPSLRVLDHIIEQLKLYRQGAPITKINFTQTNHTFNFVLQLDERLPVKAASNTKREKTVKSWR